MPLRSATRFAGTARPSLCLSLTEPTLGACLEQARAHRHLVDLVELRVDLLHHRQWAGVARFATECPLPAMCTIRRPRDGGRWIAPEAVRRRLLTAAARAPFRYLDLESDLPTGAVPLPPRGPRIIRSLHDTDGTPPHLPALLRALPRSGREIPKLAVTPHGCADLARIVGAAQAAPRPHIVLGMGPYGVATRLLAAKLGSLLTFTSAGRRAAAPGHLDPHTMQRRYRFGAIGAATPVYGLIGNPVAHSRSPEIHNRGMAVAGVPAVYVPFLVDDVDRFLDLAPSLGVRGLSVTIPHKETVMALLHRADPSVSGAGACNTVVLEQGRWTGFNTDAAGFMEPLAGLLARGGIRRATVIGAGGAARAIVWALREAGVDVLIANRTLPRAQVLAAEMSADAVALTASDLAQHVSDYSDLIVQATSLGMERHGEGAQAPVRDPIAHVPLSGREIVYDIVYAPPETPLLARARAAGCTIVFGHEMLLGQAYEQFRLFTGVPYPSVERRRLSRLLGPD
ncbi:MAG: shikimate dehydrogenase [Spirochaetaceae bacterium]|nr:shikimate dehydrogenase [Spirochaetaceae bacterium]